MIQAKCVDVLMQQHQVSQPGQPHISQAVGGEVVEVGEGGQVRCRVDCCVLSEREGFLNRRADWVSSVLRHRADQKKQQGELLLLIFLRPVSREAFPGADAQAFPLRFALLCQ